MKRLAAALFGVVLVTWVAALSSKAGSGIVAPTPITLTDVTAQAGIKFVHNSGRAGRKLLPETLGSGVAWFDADGDGWADILLINSRDWTPRGRKSLPALYRNNHDGTFTNITAGSGLDVEMYGLGVAIGDYDNDGRDDVYITALEGDHLFHNEGHGKFRDVTKAAGINNANFGASAAWVDYDRDGKLDLFVANYVQWTAKGDLWCSLDGATKSYCTPESYKGVSSKLYHNLGNGKFEELTTAAGPAIAEAHSSRGAAFGDFDNDGDMDILIMNVNEPPSLLRNDVSGGAHWLKVKLVGTKSNRSAIGATVVATYGGRRQAQAVTAQSSYLSVNDRRLHFGLGAAQSADLEIWWPSGLREPIKAVSADRLITIQEGAGVVKVESFSATRQTR